MISAVCAAACNTINASLQNGDHWLAHYLTAKLPKETHSAWEHHLGSQTHIPSYKDLEQFLNNRLITLDAIENRNCSGTNKSGSPLDHHPTKRISVHNNHAQPSPPVLRCPHCNGNHILRRCQQFLSLDCYQRKEVVSKSNLCLNCLSKSHMLARCSSVKNCYHCGQRHHSLLHPAAAPSITQAPQPYSPTVSSSQPHIASIMNNDTSPVSPLANLNLQCYSSTASHATRQNILLATARIIVCHPQSGAQATITALIDQGSEATIVSEHTVQALQLPRCRIRASIAGVGQTTGQRCNFTASCCIRTSLNPTFNLDVDSAYVMNSLTSHLPNQSFSPQNWKHINGLQLSDPLYYRSKRIDLIIGADLMAGLILPGTRIGNPYEPIAQNSHLGWMILGKFQESIHTLNIRCHQTTLDTESLLKNFCEIESVPSRSLQSDEERWCESFFKETHTRQPNGSFMVRLPFKWHFDSTMALGKSHQVALNRFLQLERRYERDPEKWIRYKEGIEEYFELGQITPAVTSERSTVSTSKKFCRVESCVLPHHVVYKEDSLTTKQRIVFDASAKTSNGRSLNDVLSVGPTLQNDLPAVLLNWRQYRHVFTADIQRMYRCIDVHPDDTQYQRILWRAADGNIKEYCLSTVTFGTASAPFTAIRVVRQLAEDERENYPLAEEVLKHEIYVDDILSGDHTISAAQNKSLQIQNALKSANMELRKWSSNDIALLDSIPLSNRCNQTSRSWDNSDTVKTLGMHWLPNQDCFTYKLQASIPTGSTKREILSSIARLFDPLGLIAPILISAKLILKEVTMAHLHSENDRKHLGWDDPVPSSIANKWKKFRVNLEDISKIRIPRSVRYMPDFSHDIQLHAFCDGSTHAYAAAVYMRIPQPDSSFYTTLITAKSKISPTKPLTIPRTELCGAVLATKLTKWVVANNRWKNAKISVTYWTDATIVLHWIKGDVTRWKTFVANRVVYILDHSDSNQWRHVPTADNPADSATRGLSPSEISIFDLWWHGPSWLRQHSSEWPDTEVPNIKFDEQSLEAKSLQIRLHTTQVDISLIERFSTYTKLVRVIAYILRFCHNAQSKKTRSYSQLSPEELDNALRCVVKIVQAETFQSDMRAILAENPLPPKSTLRNLTPFLDDGILRVRGRLKHSNLSFDRKHPIILPQRHFFTELVIQNSHQATLHGGAHLTLAHTRYKFWIPNGRQAVRTILRKCITCFRASPSIGSQLMGDLPVHRVNPPNRPFVATGVDYTGAIEIQAARLRGTSTYKGYIAIFVCLATKAVHLEAVTGLSSEHFLLAFSRFTGRRGPVQHMYSDNGTNFVGANKLLASAQQADRDHATCPTWHFTPPYSPNFGGLWEAGVKSVKHHLKRTVGSHKQTYEELATVLIRIEACLNSRPLCPLTADPDDLEALTPAHFLIGDTLLAPAHCRPKNSSFREQFLSHQNLIRQFWTQWSRDWLSHLQTRPKWCQEKENFKINELVLMKDDQLPPSQWSLGRITSLHPGEDSLVRVVTLKTKSGSQKRSISKLCRLPISC
ncbi:uncharacterized protein [Drosophila suzukii]|uniref:Endonuclease n=1 Tax=Drosophila suzukii TaxID=28584 RepID=A0ABM4U048_DROSZ